ncbi:putative Zinc finger CCCH domain-containing protein 6 [Hypsibius exemplaris]|uniref:Zinc finger CCCH domain-containing protein 6 n=1 Tax=Hypsibius exemplaris TaxID=2072580 RepID=A0A1W0WRJ5_HYPEX|nr:putative Zinc finger CCCH domain-containing protein 6 [Hypsibius exemplaris]
MSEGGLESEKPLDVEDGEIAESGEEQSDGEAEAAVTKAPTAVRSGKSPSKSPKKSGSNSKRSGDGPTDENRLDESASNANERRNGRSKKSDRKRSGHDDGEGRGKGKRKRTEPPTEASFEDELTAYQKLTAYQNSQRDRRRSREPAINVEGPLVHPAHHPPVHRQPSPGRPRNGPRRDRDGPPHRGGPPHHRGGGPSHRGGGPSHRRDGQFPSPRPDGDFPPPQRDADFPPPRRDGGGDFPPPRREEDFPHQGPPRQQEGDFPPSRPDGGDFPPPHRRDFPNHQRGGPHHQQRGGSRGKPDIPPPKEKRVPCKFFLEGRCRHGDTCPFSHNVPQTRKLEACKFYTGGHCQKGDGCVYMHGDFPCKFYHTGQQCYSGDNCKFSHANLTQDGRVALERFLEKDGKGHQIRFMRGDRPPSPNRMGGAGNNNNHHNHPQQYGQDDGRGYNGPQDDSRFRPLLPTPDPRGPGTEDNRRRRPDFFRETMPEDFRPEHDGPHGVESFNRNGFPVQETDFHHHDQHHQHHVQGQGHPQHEHHQEHHPQQPPAHRPFSGPPDDFHYRNGGSPPGSHHSSSSQQNGAEKEVPKLFARLQQRAQLMQQPEQGFDNGQTGGGDQPEEEYEARRLSIDEPSGSHGPEQVQPPRKFNLPPASELWTGSDDEDDAGDQNLAESLKRLQQRPDRNPWADSVQEDFFPEDGYDENDIGTVTFFPSAEEQANRGKCLLPIPSEHEYFPTTLPNHPGGGYPPGLNHNQYGGPPGPPYHGPPQGMPIHHGAGGVHDPNQQYYEEEQQQWYNEMGHEQQPAPYIPDPYNNMAPTPFGAPSAGGMPPSAVMDPRHHRGVGVGMLSPPGGDFGASQPEPPTTTATGQTLEDVMQQLARKLNAAAPRTTVVVPEFDGAFSRNIDPPLYRLERIHIPKASPKGVFERLIAYRTVDELSKDPRIAVMMKALQPMEEEKPVVVVVSVPAPAVKTEPVEATTTESKSQASQEFDAFTAMLSQHLKRRETDEEAGRSSPGKRPRKLTT